jgi:hypothetical protein
MVLRETWEGFGDLALSDGGSLRARETPPLHSGSTARRARR